LFAQAGAKVLIGDLQDGSAVAREVAGAYQKTDVRSSDDVQQLVARAVKDHGRLDVFFNNAGIEQHAPLAATDDAMHRSIIDVNVNGVFYGLKHALLAMANNAGPARGSIINTASVAGLRAGYAPHVYTTAKAAVIALTRTVAMELGEQGVRVNCICPGGIATPLLATAFAGENVPDEASALELVRQAISMMQPVRRAGLPEDIANAALWLATDEASFVNGHALVVDGGLTGGIQWSMQPQLMRERRPAG
jgi:NAD(P)-dependent dehydrogenase (short-subunit alcohol dehydrogenase family)